MLNPRRWNIVCWILLLLWLVPAALANTPYAPKFSGPPSIFHHTFLIGWPLPYLEITRPSGMLTVSTAFYASSAVANFLLVSLTLLAIVFLTQTFGPRFSILTLMIATTCVGFLFAVGSLVFSHENYGTFLTDFSRPWSLVQNGFVLSIYFAPLIAVLPAYFYSQLTPPSDSESAG